jgi:hypothetical protein
MNRARIRDAQAAAHAKAARAYRPGDPVRAKVRINMGTAADPRIIANPGDEGEVVSHWREGSARMLIVNFGGYRQAIVPVTDITPDWEEG